MKAILLLGAASALQVKYDSMWAETVEDLSVNDYTKDTPKAYAEQEKPKPDPKAMAALVQQEKEKARKEALDQLKNEENAKITEEMNLSLYEFAKTLKPSAMHKAL